MSKKYVDVEKELTKRAKFFAKKLWHRNYNLPVVINGRFKTTLGRYYYWHSIELSSELLDDEYLLNDTLLHELCHWYCHTGNKQYEDGSEDFEKELRRIGATSTKEEIRLLDINVLYLNKLYKSIDNYLS